MLVGIRSKLLSNPCAPSIRSIAPSAAAPAMITNSGAPLMNATRRTIRRKVIIAASSLVGRPRPLGRQLAAREVVGVDDEVEQGVEDDEPAAERQRDRGDPRRQDVVRVVLAGGLLE